MKIARLDLNSLSIHFEEIDKNSKYFLFGARGLSSKIISEEVPPDCDPLGEQNKLIIANGLLTGTPFPNSARTSVGAKSPLTGGIKESNAGGRPAMILARLGIRALVLEGKASSKTLILIDDNGIKFESAEKFAGLGNYELHERLKIKYGNKIGIYSIGPTGEWMYKNSTIATNDIEGFPSRHAGRGGMGAVMGSKNVKAIVVVPTKTSQVKIHDLKRFREVIKPFAKNLAESKEALSVYGTALGVRTMNEIGGLPTQSFRKGSYEDANKISGEKLHEIVMNRGGKKRVPCSPTCVIKCSNYYVDEKGNHVTSSLEYETLFANGSNCLINDLDTLAQIDHDCDDIGIDTIEFGDTIALAMDAGKIKWGDHERVLEILGEIRNNTTTGKLYGNGVYELGQQLNLTRIPHAKKQGIPGYDPRVFKGMSVTFATSPQGADHTAGAAIAGRVPDNDRDYGDLTEDAHKLELSYKLQVYTTVLDSMGCCYFIGPDVRTMEIVAMALNAMYDLQLTREDVIEIGKKILKLEIEFNEKAGIHQKDNDLPSFFREEPIHPTNLTVTFASKDFKDFWKRLYE
ncbi:MAG: aldehyde ferredoxin oxidoreductase C-terminal domain-containing protein [Promethearchaeota archaeon]